MVKILTAQINPTIGDIKGNLAKILTSIAKAKETKCNLLITPELALTGYPPEDLLLVEDFVKQVEETYSLLIEASSGIGLVIGTLRRAQNEKLLFNTAMICFDGQLLGFQDKMLLPTYDVFDERRYFEPAKKTQVWKVDNIRLGITICEDIWQHGCAHVGSRYIQDPILCLSKESPDLLVNLSASPFHVGKSLTRMQVVQKAARTLNCPVILCNQVGSNDSLIFDGKSIMVNPLGEVTYIAKGFSEDLAVMDTSQIKPILIEQNPMQELNFALILGIKDYFAKSGFQKACIGISGGIDSALVACLAVEALGKENVLGVAMPSRYSSSDSLMDAKELCQRLDIPLQIISIEEPFNSFLELLDPHFLGKEVNTTEENIQARIRGMILMALSNKHGYIVLSTGNKSELALGYSTLYGDMCGGLAAISDLTKEQVYALSRYINTKHDLIPERILTKAPSAELRPNQKDSDSLPEYPIIDTVLRAYIELGESEEQIAENYKIDQNIVSDLIGKIHANEYKRRQSPPGLRVTEKAFSIGRRFPIVQKWR